MQNRVDRKPSAHRADRHGERVEIFDRSARRRIQEHLDAFSSDDFFDRAAQ
jgi:hypothetical protein